jgi:hypothetical protein
MPVHAVMFVIVHCTQMSSGVLQAGAALVQFASLVQPSVHVCAVVLQTPFVPVQSMLTLHWTHVSTFVSAVTSQTGVAPVHAILFVASHCAHAPAFVPAVRHAGSAAA